MNPNTTNELSSSPSSFRRCSESTMWNQMMDFYDQNGIQSWSKGIVPSFVTSNAFIGHSYARLILGYLRDVYEKSDKYGKSGSDANADADGDLKDVKEKEKCYIVELGGGSGKLAFYILKALQQLIHRDRDHCSSSSSSSSGCYNYLNHVEIVYVLTDFTESNVKFWETHPSLQQFVSKSKSDLVGEDEGANANADVEAEADGLLSLDFAKFEAVHDTELFLRVSGTTLKTQTQSQTRQNNSSENDIDIDIDINIDNNSDNINRGYHMCIIANYLIDTLCHDIFQIDEHGMLLEGLVSVGTKTKTKNRNNTAKIRNDDHDHDHHDHNHETTTVIGNLEITNEYKYRPIHDVLPLSSSSPNTLNTNTNTESAYYNAEKGVCKDDSIHLSRVLDWYKDYFGPVPSDERKSAAASAAALNINGEDECETAMDEDEDEDEDDDTESMEHENKRINPSENENANANINVNDNDMRGKGASLLMPIGFLKAIRTLSDMANGRALIITGDKGASNPQRFQGRSDPHIAHHGSFSMMVNFHAIQLYCISRGGCAFMDDQEEASLMVNAFVLNGTDDGENGNGSGDVDVTSDSYGNVSGMDNLRHLVQHDINNERQNNYRNLLNAFEDNINAFSPNDFYLMQRSLKEEHAKPSLASIVSLLKLSKWDTEIFFKFRDSILQELPRASHGMRNHLERGAKCIWANYYHLDNEKDVAFELGRLLFGLHFFEQSLEYYQLSSDLFGMHHVTHHNQGLCHSSLSNYVAAADCFKKSLEMKPDYEKAAVWLGKVKKALKMVSMD